MVEKNFKMTVCQFAKLHKINKRTLHYYDEIGLFSPKYKDEKNGYRYYDYSQSEKLEYIYMLKKLGMSIKQIKSYIQNPNYNDFYKIADEKIKQIDEEIKLLKQIKKNIESKKIQLKLSQKVESGKITIVECSKKNLLKIDFKFKDDNIDQLITIIDKEIGLEFCNNGVGSYINVDKIYKKQFQEYDGVFVLYDNEFCKSKNIFVRPSGKYLCSYVKGNWDNIPNMYLKMLEYAQKNSIKLTGYAYEIGINEVVISNMDDYITQILIKIDE